MKAKANELDYELLSVLEKPALFTCLRIDRNSVPKGLYQYDLREPDDSNFATEIAPIILVDHMGTVLTKEPIRFGKDGYILFDEDSSPNFLGMNLTLEQFQKGEYEFDETESTQMQMG